jgi:hypothetical protein
LESQSASGFNKATTKNAWEDPPPGFWPIRNKILVAPCLTERRALEVGVSEKAGRKHTQEAVRCDKEGGRHFKVLIICVLIWINFFF